VSLACVFDGKPPFVMIFYVGHTMPAAPDFPPAPDKVTPKRALISLSDKTGLEDAAKALAAAGVEIISTGGTKAAIAKMGIDVKDVADITGFPEMMDGRVKTLHPMVHGALLAYRDAPDHATALVEHDITPIDIVWIDLYPFEKTVAEGGAFEAAIENIDIGGPAMIRSSAKNHPYVAICVDKDGMDLVIAAITADGSTDLALRKSLAAKAFARTAAYDSAVSTWFATQLGDDRFAKPLVLSAYKPCAMVKTRTNPPPFIRRAMSGLGLPMPSSFKVKSSAIIMLPIRMRPSSLLPNLTLQSRLLVSS